VISELTLSSCATWAASFAEDKVLCVWQVSSGALLGKVAARAVSALTIHPVDVPKEDGTRERTPLVFWGDRTGNVSCARVADVSGGSRVLLGHTGASISQLLCMDDRLYSADSDGCVRVTRLPFGHSVLGHLLGHRGAIQSMLFCTRGTTPAVLTACSDGKLRMFRAEPEFASLGPELLLEGSPPPHVDFVGGPLEHMVGASLSPPSRAEVLKAAGSPIRVAYAAVDRDARTPRAADEGGLVSSTGFTLPPVELTPSGADGSLLTSVRPCSVFFSALGLFGSGFVCSSLALHPSSGAVAVAVSAPPEEAARVLNVDTLRTEDRAPQKREREEDLDTTDVHRVYMIDTDLHVTEVFAISSRWASIAFLDDGALLVSGDCAVSTLGSSHAVADAINERLGTWRSTSSGEAEHAAFQDSRRGVVDWRSPTASE
jgi:hypothetical protein